MKCWRTWWRSAMQHRPKRRPGTVARSGRTPPVAQRGCIRVFAGRASAGSTLIAVRRLLSRADSCRHVAGDRNRSVRRRPSAQRSEDGEDQHDVVPSRLSPQSTSRDHWMHRGDPSHAITRLVRCTRKRQWRDNPGRAPRDLCGKHTPRPGGTLMPWLRLVNHAAPVSQHERRNIDAEHWRPRPESNRGAQICSLLRRHSATRPGESGGAH
jgi:hypothetical protein